jgi:hypothetical protein
MPVILGIREAEEEPRRIMVQSLPRQIVHETLSRKHPSHTKKKKELLEWLNVYLSSNPSTAKK